MNAASAAALLRLGDDGEGEGRLAGGFRAENLHDAPARKAADAERAVDEDIAGRDDLDVHDLGVAQPHDRAFAVFLRDLLDGEVEILVPGGGDFGVLGGRSSVLAAMVFWGEG